MEVKVKKTRRPAAGIQREVMEVMPAVWIGRAESFCEHEDIDFFLRKVSLSEAAKKFKEGTDCRFKLGEISVLLRFTSKSHCKLWRAKMKPQSSTKEVTSKYLDRLRSAAEQLAPLLALDCVTTEIAVQIFRTKISTNRHLIAWLPARLKLWEVKT